MKTLTAAVTAALLLSACGGMQDAPCDDDIHQRTSLDYHEATPVTSCGLAYGMTYGGEACADIWRRIDDYTRRLNNAARAARLAGWSVQLRPSPPPGVPFHVHCDVKVLELCTQDSLPNALNEVIACPPH